MAYKFIIKRLREAEIINNEPMVIVGYHRLRKAPFEWEQNYIIRCNACGREFLFDYFIKRPLIQCRHCPARLHKRAKELPVTPGIVKPPMDDYKNLYVSNVSTAGGSHTTKKPEQDKAMGKCEFRLRGRFGGMY